MTQQNQEDHIRKLVDVASKSIAQQQEKADALAEKRAKPSITKQVFVSMLIVAFAAIALVQYPRFHEPFGRPDPNQDAAVAEADLIVISMMIQGYNLAQGKLPSTLDEIRLPDSLATFVVENKIAYRLTEKSYALDWNLPRWTAVFDGETGKVDVVPVKSLK